VFPKCLPIFEKSPGIQGRQAPETHDYRVIAGQP
jgi:hypothetical protein